MTELADLCRFWPIAAGTADWQVAYPVQGFLDDHGSELIDGAEYHVRAEAPKLFQWEVATGLYDATTRTIARTVIEYSSDGGLKIDFNIIPQVGVVSLARDMTRIRSEVVGLISAGPYPFTNQQVFELAPGASNMEFSAAFSTSKSEVECEYPTAGACHVVLTDDLAGFLSSGSNVICRADFAAVSKVAALTFNDVVVPRFKPLWLVMPTIADVAMAGLRATFSGKPV